MSALEQELEAELESGLEGEREGELELESAEAMAKAGRSRRRRRRIRGQAGRSPAKGLRGNLRRQGFLATRHFLQRWLQRAHSQGIRFDPRTFGADFRRSPHFRQTREGYNTRIALMKGMPVIYRMGGRRGKNPVLVGLLPQDTLPKEVASVSPPRLFEAESEAELASAAFELEQELEASTEKGYFFFDVWWAPPGSGWQLVQTFPSGSKGWLYETYANAESIRLQLERTTRNQFPSGSVLARSFRWTGSKWIQFKP
jgi:hypothetical protein